MKNIIKSLGLFLIFCVLFVGFGKLLRYILIDDTNSYTRIMFHEMYEQDNIDVLFVGSSHCYRTFIPEIFDNELGVNTFNAGTSSQDLDGSYIVIKEAVKYNDIKHIYLEVFYNCAFGIYKNRTQMTQTYIISDYLRPSLDKFRYLLDASTSEYYFDSFILARREWQRLLDIGYIKNLIIKKQTKDYKNYGYAYVTGETEQYMGKGYVAGNVTVEDRNRFFNNTLGDKDFENVSDEWRNTLKDIISFCEKKDIALTLVSAPMPDFLLSDLGNYDDYVGLIENMIVGTDIQYYDLNLCREEYFPSTFSVFLDTHHVNRYGAEMVSYLLSDLINGKISENELFYNSYKEKINQMDPAVFGISYHDIQIGNDEIVRECKIISTCDKGLEYKITLKPEGKEAYTLQEFSDNALFMIEPDDHGICTIEYRTMNLPKKVQMMDTFY